VGYDLLRQFYWFENAVWRINKITDWNIGLDDVTKIEFVKVQDLEGYTSITQTRSNTIKLFASKYNVAPNGEQVTLNINTENGGKWVLKGNDNGLIFSRPDGVGNGTVTLTIPQTKAPANNTNYTITAVDDEGNTHSIVIVQGYNNSTRLNITPSKLIVSSNGGTYDIDFEWINQGDNEVSAASFMGDVTGNVEIDGFSAAVSVNKNTEDAIISGKVLFEAGNYDAEVLIDQMPEMLEFGKDGGEYEFAFNYNTDVRYNYIPYWATIEGNKLTVLPNYYETERGANIMVQNDRSFAYIRLKQAVGSSPAPETPKVSPNSLYFDASEGTQFLSINIPNTWVIVEDIEWVFTNLKNGDGAGIIGVSVSENYGETRSGVLIIKDVVSGAEYSVFVTQVGLSTTRTFTITPSSINVPKEGGIFNVQISYVGRNGDFVSMEKNGDFTVSDLVWSGENAETVISVTENTSTNIKEMVLTFNTSIGKFDLEIKQYPSNENIDIEKESLYFGDDGGGDLAPFTTNVPWIASVSDSWIEINPTEGEEGYCPLAIVTSPNTSITPRTGYVWIDSQITGERLSTITIQQSGLVEEIKVIPSTVTFNAEGGIAKIKIMSNTDWTIETL
jgi:hypothetical protein